MLFFEIRKKEGVFCGVLPIKGIVRAVFLLRTLLLGGIIESKLISELSG